MGNIANFITNRLIILTVMTIVAVVLVLVFVNRPQLGDTIVATPTPVAVPGTLVEVEPDALNDLLGIPLGTSVDITEVVVTAYEIPAEVPVRLESPGAEILVAIEPQTIEQSAILNITPLPSAVVEELSELPTGITTLTRVFDLALGAAGPTGPDQAVAEEASAPKTHYGYHRLRC
ncbi:MAG: hypothetical protein BZY80_03180 [SAR202 cluster bacterium Io17-Chloro-G2]|nr:MAG: hypothetical protein BZY80_03180 [SAR202 cluster bacterium Io17-Chloro-G2]